MKEKLSKNDQNYINAQKEVDKWRRSQVVALTELGGDVIKWSKEQPWVFDIREFSRADRIPPFTSQYRIEGEEPENTYAACPRPLDYRLIDGGLYQVSWGVLSSYWDNEIQTLGMISQETGVETYIGLQSGNDRLSFGSMALTIFDPKTKDIRSIGYYAGEVEGLVTVGIGGHNRIFSYLEIADRIRYLPIQFPRGSRLAPNGASVVYQEYKGVPSASRKYLDNHPIKEARNLINQLKKASVISR